MVTDSFGPTLARSSGLGIAAVSATAFAPTLPALAVNLSHNQLRALPTGWLSPADVSRWAEIDLAGNPGADPNTCGTAWAPAIPGSDVSFCMAQAEVLAGAWSVANGDSHALRLLIRSYGDDLVPMLSAPPSSVLVES